MDSLLKNKHLMSRAGFGISIDQADYINEQTPRKISETLFREYPFTEILYQTPDYIKAESNDSKLNAEQRRLQQKTNQKQNEELNLNFLMNMVYGKDQLTEKMAFFWHGHFATRIINPKFNQQLLNFIRKNALGSFRNLLIGVSKSPAMLSFLNNQQNKKDHPNENFAREVMELFTMGRGNYSETDVKELARAFTGWGYDKEGNFKERKNHHDEGEKTFLGKKGKFNGDDVLEIILEQKSTAQFITEKIYRFFVNEIPNQSIISKLSKDFYESDYNIKSLMKSIFTSKWFYDQKNIGNRIKSPTELIVGMMRILPMEIQNPENIVIYQKLLGQMLLYPPNVAGWPNGKSWIDSSTLMLRMQIPQIWSGIIPMEYSAREDDDIDMGMKSREVLNKSYKNPNIKINWQTVKDIFKNKNPHDYLIINSDSVNMNIVEQFSSDTDQINTIINIMSTPEYQLM
ncbi:MULTISPECIES: DUF1800 family protein [Chryseobacterium]|uniref:Protein of uncharacterized function (DUF1800) n=1 Tax=Chryseobacterium taihuense TaxID=1141221 RepID=A0A4V6IE17_9FLAO|nr:MULTISPECIES: DUF1800 domain-containing protein [Chryseobacterium]QQV01411.1 DUF1800 domain-containing protein [Chryseobacterium sp. FDAARGOS 1104]VFB05404.1 Protein of uncharacterised function (DUF1800) [Chryseobacterium taihuense]